MTSRKAWTAGLVALALWSPALRAQVPGVPPIGAGRRGLLGGWGHEFGLGAAGGLGGGLSGATTAAQPTTLWSFLGLSGSNLQACKAKFLRQSIRADGQQHGHRAAWSGDRRLLADALSTSHRGAGRGPSQPTRGRGAGRGGQDPGG